MNIFGAPVARYEGRTPASFVLLTEWVQDRTCAIEPFGDGHFRYLADPPEHFVRIPGRLGMRGLALCLIETGREHEVVKAVITANWSDAAFRYECLSVCPSSLFVNEHDVNNMTTSPWSTIMAGMVPGLGRERYSQVAMMSALPWQVRLPMLSTLDVQSDDSKQDPAIWQIIRECAHPQFMRDDRIDHTPHIATAVHALEQLMVRGGGWTDAEFEGADPRLLLRLADWAGMEGCRYLQIWIARLVDRIKA